MNQDFYPTPGDLISTMIEGVEFGEIANVLEPSAGKGDICDYLKEMLPRDTSIDVIELDEDLQAALKGKGYNLVFNDFLGFSTHKKYDLIIANFPFSEGDKHLLRAIQLQEMYGGSLVCLVNAETIRNPYTNLRQVVAGKLKDYGARIDYIAGAFKKAERPTDVEVALIRLEIPARDKSYLILENLKRSEQQDVAETLSGQVVETDFIKSLVSRFDVECKLGIKLITEYFALKPYIIERLPKGDDSDKYNKPLIRLEIGSASDYNNDYINEYVKGVRHKYWELLLANNSFRQPYTSNILKELDGKLAQLSECDFSVFNIRELERELSKSIVVGIEDAILRMFDEFSQKFAYIEETGNNIHYYNGWKTNKAHRINKKVILPINGFSSYSYSSREKLDNYYIHERMRDMVKVFDYLAAEITNVPLLVSKTIEQANSLGNFRHLDFHYFEATFYKKGTCHIVFKDERLLQKFNIYGSQKKEWLPPNYGKAAYREMSQEEKAVIDDFQGEQAYSQVMAQSDYYLVGPATPLLLDTAA